MSALERNYLSVGQAAQLAGLTHQNIYKLIPQRKIPVETERFGRSLRHRIPAKGFLDWLEKQIAWHEHKLSNLKKSYKDLKEYLN